MVVLLLFCSCSANATSIDLASSGVRTLIDRSFNFDTLFSNWYGFENVYCHIHEYDGDSLYTAFSDNELCINSHDGIWSYDVKGKGIYLDPSKDYLLTFYTEDYKYKTHELFCSGRNLGKIAVCNQTVYEDPYDYSSYVYDLYWTDSSDEASLFCITQTGNVIGHQLPDGVEIYDLFIEFLKNGVEYAATITNRSIQETVDDLAYSLGYGYQTVSEAIIEAEIDIEWSVSNSRLEPRYGGSSSSSGESHWGSSHGSSYTKPDDADTVPYLLTDSGLIKTQKGQGYLYQCKLTTDEYISLLYGSVVFDHTGIIVNADRMPDDPYQFMFPYFQRDIKAYRTIENNSQSVSFSYRPTTFITIDSNTIVIQLYFIVTADSGIHQLYSSIHLEDEYKIHIDSKYYQVEESIIPIGEEAILGDADGNSAVESVDTTYVQRYASNVPTPYPDSQLMRADVDGDGNLTVMDATAIQYYLANMNTPYHIGQPVK